MALDTNQKWISGLVYQTTANHSDTMFDVSECLATVMCRCRSYYTRIAIHVGTKSYPDSVDIAFHNGDSALLAINVHAVDHHL